jgi:hypothetical protein
MRTLHPDLKRLLNRCLNGPDNEAHACGDKTGPEHNFYRTAP